MADVQVIDMVDVKDKWTKLMLLLQNSTRKVFRFDFDNMAKTRRMYSSMLEVVNRNPSWFSIIVVMRGTSVFVVNVKDARKVVLKDG